MPLPSGSAFGNILPFTLQYEGGYVNLESDRGGATNRGVTQKTYDHWRIAQGLEPQDVKLCSMEETSAIYQSEYWNFISNSTNNVPLLLCVFDASVHHGPARALNFLKQCNNDIDQYCNLRETFMKAIVAHNPSQQIFLHGWLNRVESVRGVAHSWAS